MTISEGHIYICDFCGEKAENGWKKPPTNWRNVIVPGWVGYFQVCSAHCELKLVRLHTLRKTKPSS